MSSHLSPLLLFCFISFFWRLVHRSLLPLGFTSLSCLQGSPLSLVFKVRLSLLSSRFASLSLVFKVRLSLLSSRFVSPFGILFQLFLLSICSHLLVLCLSYPCCLLVHISLLSSGSYLPLDFWVHLSLLYSCSNLPVLWFTSPSCPLIHVFLWSSDSSFPRVFWVHMSLLFSGFTSHSSVIVYLYLSSSGSHPPFLFQVYPSPTLSRNHFKIKLEERRTNAKFVDCYTVVTNQTNKGSDFNIRIIM